MRRARVLLFALGATAAIGVAAACGGETLGLEDADAGSDAAAPFDATSGAAAASDSASTDARADASGDARSDASGDAGSDGGDAGDAGDGGTEPTVTFAVIGDFGSGSARELAVANLVLSWNPDFIVTTGDNDYSTDPSSYDPNVGQFYHDYIAPYNGAYGAGAAENKFFPVLGNHDWDVANGDAFFDFFDLPGNERYFELVKGPVHFVYVDSDIREPDGNDYTSAQGVWAQTAMAAIAEPFTFVVFHHPAYTSGTRSLWMDWPWKTWGADAVLTGHVHNYERLVGTDGLAYFVNGQGGKDTAGFGSIHPASKVRYNARDGAQLVTVTATKATFRYYAVDGTLVDTYAIDPSGASVPP